MINSRQCEKVLKALANRRRLEIIQYLKKEKEATVGDIAEAIKLSFKSTSRHLSILLAADLVEKEQRNLSAYYSLVPSPALIARGVISVI